MNRLLTRAKRLRAETVQDSGPTFSEMCAAQDAISANLRTWLEAARERAGISTDEPLIHALGAALDSGTVPAHDEQAEATLDAYDRAHGINSKQEADEATDRLSEWLRRTAREAA